MKLVCLLYIEGFKWFLRLFCWPFKIFAEGIAREKWKHDIQEYRRVEHLDKDKLYNWEWKDKY